MRLREDIVENLPLYLHVGYHKTATTYMQYYVYNNHPEILYLGMPIQDKELAEFFIKFKFIPELKFRPTALRREFEKILKKIVDKRSVEETKNQKIILISREGLHAGPEFFGADVVQRANRIRLVFPSARIIIGIRNQVDYIESFYKQYVKLGGKLSLRDFIYESYACNYCLLPKLEYDKIIKLYQRYFGDDSVYVYLHEDFKSNMEQSIFYLMEFLNIKKDVDFKNVIMKKGLSNFSISFLRILNKFLASDFNEQYYKLGGFRRIDFRESVRNKMEGVLEKIEKNVSNNFFSNKKLLREHEIQKIKKYFLKSNKELSAILNRNIFDLGY